MILVIIFVNHILGNETKAENAQKYTKTDATETPLDIKEMERLSLSLLRSENRFECNSNPGLFMGDSIIDLKTQEKYHRNCLNICGTQAKLHTFEHDSLPISTEKGYREGVYCMVNANTVLQEEIPPCNLSTSKLLNVNGQWLCKSFNHNFGGVYGTEILCGDGTLRDEKFGKVYRNHVPIFLKINLSETFLDGGGRERQRFICKTNGKFLLENPIDSNLRGAENFCMQFFDEGKKGQLQNVEPDENGDCPCENYKLDNLFLNKKLPCIEQNSYGFLNERKIGLEDMHFNFNFVVPCINHDQKITQHLLRGAFSIKRICGISDDNEDPPQYPRLEKGSLLVSKNISPLAKTTILRAYR